MKNSFITTACTVGTCIMKTFAMIYATLVLIITIWTWYSELKYLHSSIEHLLPICLLSFVSLPASLSTEAMYNLFPEMFNFPLLYALWITICATVQSSVIFLLSHLINKKISMHNKQFKSLTGAYIKQRAP